MKKIILIFCLGFLFCGCTPIWTPYNIQRNFAGNNININGTISEDNTTITIKKVSQNKNSYTGAIDIGISPPVQEMTGQFPIFNHRIIFTTEKEEDFSFIVPFNTPKLLIVIQTETDTLKLRLSNKIL